MFVSKKRNLKHEIIYDIIYNDNPIKIQWITSQIGMHGNGQADKLAKNGMESETIINNKILIHDAKIHWKNEK